MKNTKRYLLTLFSTHYFLLIIFLLPLLWNLLRPGFYTSHDGEWMVIRLTAFHDALRSGQIPARWLSRLDHEYGYPVTNFLYPLPFYLAEPFYALTQDPVLAVKIIMGLAIVSMAVGSYALFKKWGTTAAIIGALTYVYSPYISYNLYTRGSLGELVAMGIVPWVFWALSSRKLWLSSVFTAALITSHNVVAVLFLPFVLLFIVVIFFKQRKKPIIYHLLSIILGFGLSAFFWLPALAEYRFVRASQIAVADFENEYLSLTEAFKRSGPIAAIANLGLPLFFLTENSRRFWDFLKPLQIIQFPWRLLSLFSFTSAVLSAFLVWKLERHYRFKFFVIAIIIFISFISVISFLTPQSFINHPPTYYETNDDTTTVRAEYTPIWVKNFPEARPETLVKHYYPGLKLFVDGKERLIDPNRTDGEIRPAESDLGKNVKFVWSETPLRASADLISVASALTILFLFLDRKERLTYS